MKSKILSPLAILLFFGQFAFSQNAEQTTRKVLRGTLPTNQYTPSEKYGDGYFEINTILEVPFLGEGPFTAFSLDWAQAGNSNQVHALEYSSEETWYTLPLNHHIENPSDAQKSELAYLTAGTKTLSLKIITTSTSELNFVAHFFNPDHTSSTSAANTPTQRSLICPCPEPDFQDRGEWCPNGNCPPNPSPSMTSVKFLIVHHSAGSNQSSDWSAVVRSIWDYHVNTLGWSDVGYNWLVDPAGNLYEGRGQGVLGAHFCGTNSQTMGVCMIGTYTNVEPQDTAVQTLTKMLAWNSCEENIDPLGSGNHSSSGLTLDRISGHRDGCATECPGEAFYPTLTDVRQAVADYIEEQCTPLVVDMLVDTIFTNVDPIIAGEEMLLRCRITNNSNIEIENIQVQYQIDGTTLYTDVVQDLNSGSSINLTEAHTFPMAGDYEYCIKIDAIDGETELGNNEYCGTLPVEINTSIQELAAAQMSIFPNPSTGDLFLQNPNSKSGQIQIFNTLGQSVLDTNLSGLATQAINLNQQAKGVYILRVVIDGKAFFEKVLLE